MSRTYHHGYKAKDRINKNDNWMSNEPREWRRLYKHKKRRAEWQRCLQLSRNGVSWENIPYPQDTRPWIYYW